MSIASMSPEVSAEMAEHPFYQGLRVGRLLYPRCAGCGQALPYDARGCNRCGEAAIDWAESRGGGALRARVTYHRAYREDLPAPYQVVLVRLDEGVNLLGRLRDAAAQPAPGERLRAEIGEDEVLFVSE